MPPGDEDASPECTHPLDSPPAQEAQGSEVLDSSQSEEPVLELVRCNLVPMFSVTKSLYLVPGNKMMILPPVEYWSAAPGSEHINSIFHHID